MRTDIATGSPVNFPLFHVDNVAQHLQELAVDANGQLLSRYESGIWKVVSPAEFARDVAGLFQHRRGT